MFNDTTITQHLESFDIEERANESPFKTNPVHWPALMEIRQAHRLRQRLIMSKNRIGNAQGATIRSLMGIQKFNDEDSKEAKAAQAIVAKTLKDALADPSHEFHLALSPYTAAIEPLQKGADLQEKVMIKGVKTLPIIEFCRNTKFLGESTTAAIIAETTGIYEEENPHGGIPGTCFGMGDYKSVSAIWKRMGLGVRDDGRRQGNPGQGATAEDWVKEKYSPKRRSVAYVGLQYLIGGMGNWRPAFGADTDNDESLTEYQKLFASRVRFEMQAAELPIVDKAGKESYKAHQIRRAMRIVEKRALQRTYIAYRACMA